MTYIALSPCPFCGSHNVAQGASSDRISVWCFCGARGPDVAFPQDCIDPVTPIKECYALWNRRASPSQVAPANPAQVTDAMMPAYGTIDFLELGKDVNEATTGQRLDFDFGDGYPGHAMLPALNFNSLSRIVSKYITAAIGAGGQAVAMTVIDPDEWEPCSPSYLSRGGSCSAPRVWNEAEGNHWHPKHQSALSQPHPDDERVVEALRETADALETLLSADPDMPTYQSDYDAADQQLERARAALAAKEGR